MLHVYGNTGRRAASVLTTLLTASLSTNRAGNSNGAGTIGPADVAVHAAQDEYGLVWRVTSHRQVVYTT